MRTKSTQNRPILACRQLGHMSHEFRHIVELGWENPLFWLSYPQASATFEITQPAKKAYK
jgi:hypothetical protein